MTKSVDTKTNPMNMQLLIATLISFFLAVVLWMLYPLFVKTQVTGDLSQAGQFGDQYGGLNALFSVLAFIALVATLLLQRSELGLQREELKDTREVMKEQREQMELQNETLIKQSIETTFFKMLELYNDIVNTTDTTFITGRPTVGRASFRELRDKLNATYHELSRNTELSSGQYLPHAVRNFSDSYGYIYEHVPLFVLETLRYLDGLNIEKHEIRRYIDLLRSQLSRDEYFMMFYFGCSQRAPTDYKELIEKYGFFEGFDAKHLINNSHPAEYSAKAFRRK